MIPPSSCFVGHCFTIWNNVWWQLASMCYLLPLIWELHTSFILLQYHWQYSWTSYKSIWTFPRHFIFGSERNWSFCLNSYQQQSSPCSLLASLSQRSCMKREPIPVHHKHSPTDAGLDIMLRDFVWSCKFPCFVFHCLTCKQHSIFLFRYTDSIISCSSSWKCPCLGLVKDFLVESAFYFLHLHTFAF